MQKPVAVAMTCDSADDEREFFPQAVFFAAVLDDFARLQSTFELLVEFLPLRGSHRTDAQGQLIERQRSAGLLEGMND